MKQNESSEMYLKTILLIEMNEGHAHVKEIADLLQVSKASVTKAINSLKKKDYILQDNYGPVFLTESGRELANKILYKHKVLSKYLELDLDLSAEEAEDNACRMEHIISDDMLVAIEKKLDIKIEDEMRFALEDKK